MGGVPESPIRESSSGPGLGAEGERLSDELARVSARLEALEEEREFLFLHSRNLEASLRRLVGDLQRATQRAAELDAVLERTRASSATAANSRSWRPYVGCWRRIARWYTAKRSQSA